MSSTIWTRCGASAAAGPLRLRAWRAIEAQHRTATLKLVDSVEEHAVLEELLEDAKPPLPDTDEFRGLHYLLATPFRYPPLRHGSRFGRGLERGIWYGAEDEATTLAETAYYRFVFLAGTTATIPHLASEHTTYAVDVATTAGVDLTSGPFAEHRGRISSATSYATSQPLGSAMRGDGIEAFRYLSARAADGVNVGLFTPAAFASRSPRGGTLRTWHGVVTPGQVVFKRRDVLRDTLLSYPRETFLVRGELPSPAAG